MKKQITEYITSHEDVKLSTDNALHSWWYDPRDNTNYRLTLSGNSVFNRYLQSYSYTIEPEYHLEHNGSTFLKLNRIPCPFFINYKERTLILYGSKEATMMQLFGSVSGFLDSFHG